MQKDRVAIIFGGKSSEHEVSLMSAASVIRNIDKEKHDLIFVGITRDGVWGLLAEEAVKAADIIENDEWEETAKEIAPSDITELCDFVLPIVHGQYCEDGKLQGLLEMLNIPYGGCGVFASALCMDKAAAKDIFSTHGIPVCKSVFTTEAELAEDIEAVIAKAEKEIGYPVFVKPVNMGSSVGVTKAEDKAALTKALELARKYDRRILIEEYIDCREIENAMIGNDTLTQGEIGEIVPCAEFYDYDAKYHDGGASKLEIPAKVSEKQRTEIMDFARKAYKAADCEGFARIDFFINKKDGSVILNEINTLPGFTKISMFPKLMEASGVPYSKAIEMIIELGYERHYAKNNRQTSL